MENDIQDAACKLSLISGSLGILAKKVKAVGPQFERAIFNAMAKEDGSVVVEGWIDTNKPSFVQVMFPPKGKPEVYFAFSLSVDGNSLPVFADGDEYFRFKGMLDSYALPLFQLLK